MFDPAFKIFKRSTENICFSKSVSSVRKPGTAMHFVRQNFVETDCAILGETSLTARADARPEP